MKNIKLVASILSLFSLVQTVMAQTNPTAFDLSSGNYTLTEWSDASPAGTYPANMAFWTHSTTDPDLTTPFTADWECFYNLTSVSRFTGQNANGIGMLNTGNSQTLANCFNDAGLGTSRIPAGRSGAVVLSLDATGRENISVSWTGRTISPASRPYKLTLQYRVGNGGGDANTDWQDFSPAVEYFSGNDSVIPATSLPTVANNQPFVQVRWVYNLNDIGVTGARTEVALDDITVTSDVFNAPPASVFYSKATGFLNDLSTWGENPDGSGAAPANFSNDGVTYNIVNNTNPTINADWFVFGLNSKIILGNGTDSINFDIPQQFICSSVMDVRNSATVTLNAISLPTFNNLEVGSTVHYNQNFAKLIEGNVPFYNLKISNSEKTIEEDVTINGDLTIANVNLKSAVSAEITLAGDLILDGNITYNSNFQENVSFRTSGNGNQTITGNNNEFRCYNFRSDKTDGSLTLNANSDVFAYNNFRVKMENTAIFSDGGNDIECGDDLVLTGANSNFNFSGTLFMTGITAGNNDIEDENSDVVEAVLNNLIIEDITTIRLRPSNGSGTLNIAGDFTINGSINSAENNFDIKGDLSIGANANLDIANSEFIFSGNSPQNFTSAINTEITHLTIDNADGLTLNSDLSVAGNLNLTTGNINTSATAILTLLEDANVLNGGTNSFVNGPLSRVNNQLNQTLIYPTGRSTFFRPMELNIYQDNTDNTTYTAEQIEGTATSRTLPVGVDSVSSARYYNITKGAGANLDSAFIQLSYGNSDNVSDAGVLRVLKENGTAWENLEGVGSANNIGNISSALNFNTLGDFVLAFASSSTPLPLIYTSNDTLSGFTAAVSSPSSVQSLNVYAENLIAGNNLTLTAPTNFEISLNATTGYSSSIILNDVVGLVDTTEIFVRLNATQAGNTSGNLVLSSTGVTSKNVWLSGNAINVLPQPTAFNLCEGDFEFTAWSDTSAAGTYPENMIFYQHSSSAGGDSPSLTDEPDGVWPCVYNLTSRARVNGLGSGGFSFINTGSAQTDANCGAVDAAWLGAAALALNTEGRNNIELTWTAGTVTENDRDLRWRLQYRTSSLSPWLDVEDNGNPVEYVKQASGQDTTFVNNLSLLTSGAVDNQALVEIRWKYYQEANSSGGARPQLSLDDIFVSSDAALAESDAVSNSNLATGISSVNNGTIANSTDGEEFWSFSIRDGGNDNLPTIVNSLQLNAAIDNQVADFSALFEDAALFDGTTLIANADSSNTNSIFFSNLNLNIANGDSLALTLRVSFQNRNDLIDGQITQLALSNNGLGLENACLSSQMTNFDIVSPLNTIEVIATEILITNVSANIIINQNFDLTAQQVDANGNIDLDNQTFTVSLGTPGTGNLSAATGLSGNSNNGAFSWSDLQYDVAESFNVIISNGTASTDTLLLALASCTAPTIAASNVIFTNVDTTSIELSWDNGNGNNRIILAQEAQAVTDLPVDSTTYGFNAAFGDSANMIGNAFIVYNGNGNSATVTNLLPNTNYHFAILEYGCAEPLYLTSAFASADTTTESLPLPPSLFVSVDTLSGFFVSVGNSSAVQSFDVAATGLTAGNGLDLLLPAPFEMSLNASTGFANSINIADNNGLVDTTTVFVRLSPASAGSQSAWINISSVGFGLQDSVYLEGESILLLPQPSAFNLCQGDYVFDNWAATSSGGTYPNNMLIYQLSAAAGGANAQLSSEPDGLWPCVYNISSGSRVMGADADGLIFANTGGVASAANCDSTGAGFLGAAVVALNASNRENIEVSWLAGTDNAGSRNYALRLQYRTDSLAAWSDVLDGANAVEYLAATTGDDSTFTTNLSAVTNNAVDNQNLVQLRWRYYEIGTGSGTRPRIRLDDITVSSSSQNNFSDVVSVANSGTSQISSLTNGNITAVTDGEQVWEFTIRDGGLAFPDADNLPTVVTDIFFTQALNNTVADWSNAIEDVALFDGTNLIANANTIDSGLIAFENLNNLNVGDNDSLTLSVRITLKSSGLNDGERIQLQLNDTNIIADDACTSSQFGNFGNIQSDDTLNVINVEATALIITNVSSNITVDTDFEITVVAVDANGNTDISPRDFTASLGAVGTGVLSSVSGLTNQTAVNGTFTWTDLQYDVVEAFEVNITDGILDVDTLLNAVELCEAPTTNASNLTFNNIELTSVDLTWDNGDGDNRIVVARQNNAIVDLPQNGINYNADSQFGTPSAALGSGFVVYNGTGSNVTVTGLTKNTTYHFAIFEYNCVPELYLTSGFETADVLTDNDISAAFDALNTEALVVYPNPIASGQSLMLNKKIDYRIYDSVGRMVASGINANIIETENWSGGVYILVSDAGESKRIIVRK